MTSANNLVISYQMSRVYENLAEAVDKNNAIAINELLNFKAWPFLTKYKRILLNLAISKNHPKIIKWLVYYKAYIDESLIDYLFDPANSLYAKDLLAYIITCNQNNDMLLKNIFVRLIGSDYETKLEQDILKLLLRRGLSANDFVLEDKKYLYNYSPFHLAVMNDRIDFASILLKHGADVNKKTSNGITPLNLAVMFSNEVITEWLLMNGANINEKSATGKTALHEACIRTRSGKFIKLFLENGADVNIMDDCQCTAVVWTRDPNGIHENERILVKELARMEYERRTICNKNLSHLLKHDYLKKMFDSCLKELKKMSSFVFYGNLTLYDVLKRKNKKLVFLTKRKDFITAFKSCWNRKAFKNFAFDLDSSFEEAVRKRNIFEDEEEKLYSVLRDYLPALAISKTSYFANEHII